MKNKKKILLFMSALSVPICLLGSFRMNDSNQSFISYASNEEYDWRLNIFITASGENECNWKDNSNEIYLTYNKDNNPNLGNLPTQVVADEDLEVSEGFNWLDIDGNSYGVLSMEINDSNFSYDNFYLSLHNYINEVNISNYNDLGYLIGGNPLDIKNNNTLLIYNENNEIKVRQDLGNYFKLTTISSIDYSDIDLYEYSYYLAHEGDNFIPNPPSAYEGYIFKGWYLDNEFKDMWDGIMSNNDLTIYAKYERIKVLPENKIRLFIRYDDVNPFYLNASNDIYGDNGNVKIWAHPNISDNLDNDYIYNRTGVYFNSGELYELDEEYFYKRYDYFDIDIENYNSNWYISFISEDESNNIKLINPINPIKLDNSNINKIIEIKGDYDLDNSEGTIEVVSINEIGEIDAGLAALALANFESCSINEYHGINALDNYLNTFIYDNNGNYKIIGELSEIYLLDYIVNQII